MEVQVGPSVITIHADDYVVVCEPDTKMSSTKEQGFFAHDTRFVSGYRLKLGRVAPVLLDSTAVESDSARFELTNADLVTPTGPLPRGTLHLRLDRTVDHGVHDDYQVTSFSPTPVELDLEVSVESDFADLFDVKSGTLVRRGTLQTEWHERSGRLVTRYCNGEFRRSFALAVQQSSCPPEYANGGLLFRIRLEPKQSFRTCLLWEVELGDGAWIRPPRACSDLIGSSGERKRARRSWVRQATRISTSDPEISALVTQAIDDLSSLRMHRHDEAASRWDGAPRDEDAWVPAAGVPWFVSLFGRDALVVSLQTLALSPRFALGSLRALAALQADGYDDERDMQPGKIEHEIRHGELAALHLVPHTPYYGTHEATTLYVWTAAQAWHWHGDRAELDAVRPHVERALAWIDRDGDLDGDGLQEYKTRASHGGYYNQGWKDSGDAIVDAEGRLAELPIALCEHQGYVVAAKRAWAKILEDVYHEKAAASQLRDEAERLAGAIEERFFWEEEGTYYLGLDGRKRPIASVASNPGHLLWAGAVVPERARLVARRLLAPDMWSGWGIRTLSAEHPSYNPFSYQRGSVWPHDNVIAAAGFRRYGLDEEAATVARALLDAGLRFQSLRLPELFAGLERDPGGFPVQYLGANVPQAWAAGSLVQLVTTLLGLDADASAGLLTLRPALPPWLEEVRLENLCVGTAAADLVVRRLPEGGHGLDVGRVRGPLEVVLDEP
jgi:glycogen debranching enzyme